jgi:hypothetical protein
VYALRSVGVAETAEELAEVTVANPRSGNTAFSAMVESMRARASVSVDDDALIPGAVGSGY